MGLFNRKKEGIELIKENYPEIANKAEKSDFARPFPEYLPNFWLLADDEGYMWEFYNGDLSRSLHTFDPVMMELKSHLDTFGEGSRACAMELKRLVETGEIEWMFPAERSKPLSEFNEDVPQGESQFDDVVGMALQGLTRRGAEIKREMFEEVNKRQGPLSELDGTVLDNLLTNAALTTIERFPPAELARFDASRMIDVLESRAGEL